MMSCAFGTLFVLLRLLERRDRPRLAIVVFLAVATLLYWGHFVYFNRMTDWLPVADTIYCACNLAVYPLFLWYVCVLTGARHRVILLRVVLPLSLAVVLTIGALYVAMRPDATGTFVERYLYHDTMVGLDGLAHAQAVAHVVAKVLFAAGVVVTVIVGFADIERYHTMLNSVCVDAEDKTLYRVKGLIVLLVVTSVLSFGANAIGRYYFIDSTRLLAVPSILFSLLLLGIAYVGAFQESTGDEMRHFMPDIGNEDDMPPQPSQPLAGEILTLLTERRLFLRQDLKMVDVATLLNSNRTYLYRAIHDGLGVSFNELINRLRVEHAKRLLAEHPDWKVSDVARESGYLSLATYYRNLKAYGDSQPMSQRVETHQTPSAEEEPTPA